MIANNLKTTKYNLGMRDKFSDVNFFDETIAMWESRNAEKTLAFFEERYLDDAINPVSPNGSRKLSLIATNAIVSVANYIPCKYSRGDGLDDIDEKHFKELLKRYEFLANELASGNPKKYVVGFGDDKLQVSDVHSVYTILAWCLCFETVLDSPSIRSLFTHLCKPNFDRLSDTVRSSFADVAGISESACAYPRAFGLLDQIIDAEPSQRAELVSKYLVNWPKHISQLKFNSLAFNCSKSGSSLKSRKDLVAGMNNHFKGYWAWEAALVVKFFGIDDSSFKDNEYYPYDLVHYTPPLNLSNKLSVVGSAPQGENGLEQAALAGIVIENSSDPKTPLTADQYYIRDEQHNYIYCAYVPKKGEDASSASFNYLQDSAVRYSVGFTPNSDDVEADKGTLALVLSQDDWLVRESLSMNMVELLDKLGRSESYPFMDEVHLQIDNEFSETSWVYCSRHKAGVVPPLMVFRFVKFNDDGMLFVDCMVRDESLTYLDVGPHWNWLINQYEALA